MLNKFDLVFYQEKFILYHNDTCKIFTEMIYKQMQVQVSIFPTSHFIAIRTDKKADDIFLVLKDKKVSFRNVDENQGEYNFKFDSDDRAIYGYLIFIQLQFQPRFCNEDWSELEEPPVFCDKHNGYQYVKCDDLQIMT